MIALVGLPIGLSSACNVRTYTQADFDYVAPSNEAVLSSIEIMAKEDRSGPGTRLCLTSGDVVDVNGALSMSGKQICGEVRLSSPFRRETQCFQSAEIAHIGLATRTFVLGTPGRPAPCPDHEF